MTTTRQAALVAVFTVVIAAVARLSLLVSVSEPETTPLDGPLLQSLPQFQGTHSEQLLWGSYRSGLYMGLRMRVPKSLLAGLAWFDPNQPGGQVQLRHEAQSSDGLSRFGWEAHDGRTFGRQELVDGAVHLSTHLMKQEVSGCSTGGDWAVRITARPAKQPGGRGGTNHNAHRRVSLIFYIMDEGGSPLQLEGAGSAPVPTGSTLVSGKHPVTGSWTLSMLQQPAAGSSKPARVHHLGARTLATHKVTELLKLHLKLPAGRPAGRAWPRLPNAAEAQSNLMAFQITLTVPGQVDFTFLAGQDGAPPPPPSRAQQPNLGLSGWMPSWLLPSAQGPAQGSTPPAISQRGPPCQASRTSRLENLQGDKLTGLLKDSEADFDRRVTASFGNLEASDLPAGTAKAAKMALSNMLGGLGYFYGSSKIKLPGGAGAAEPRIVESWPSALYTAVPGRSFFPRGFLWDEGFHQLLVRKWDPAISRDVLAHWLDLVNSQGWIAREQILGEEARARVPAEFMADADFLRAAWPRLSAWLRWFERTQQGPVPGSYRWRGRDGSTTRELNPKTLASGLDDFPRASHPSEDERHLDLRCWMALAYQSLATIGSSLKLPAEEVQPFAEKAATLSDPAELVRLHWDPASRRFLDWGNHTQGVSLQWMLQRLPDGRPYGLELQRVVDQHKPPQLQYVPHFGFVSLFPLLMRLLPADSPQLEALLQQLPKTKLLWSPYGLRSLSKDSSLYNQHNTKLDAPYWRGAVWFNINYLTLAALQHYSQVEGPARAQAELLHQKLRRTLLANIVHVYKTTGSPWENYDDQDGHGKGTHPFTGWTALFVMAASGELLNWGKVSKPAGSSGGNNRDQRRRKEQNQRAARNDQLDPYERSQKATGGVHLGPGSAAFAAVADVAALEGPAILRCLPCQATFSTEAQLQQHNEGPTHRKALARIQAAQEKKRRMGQNSGAAEAALAAAAWAGAAGGEPARVARQQQEESVSQILEPLLPGHLVFSSPAAAA
ncbi:hypothetical protein WJX74_010329 [Apatococcus lobatus]|uniref:Mannosyl-oligosaccharide glucosidase n=1 Tax=Apatococcus lobatus TaxID=904363 RepID=A0AAW1RSX9_9CHLO